MVSLVNTQSLIAPAFIPRSITIILQPTIMSLGSYSIPYHLIRTVFPHDCCMLKVTSDVRCCCRYYVAYRYDATAT